MTDTERKDYDVLLIGYEDWENLGLRSISAFLIRHGLKVKVEPYKSSSKEAILASIRNLNPKIVGFSLIFQMQLFEFANFIAYLRQNGVTAHFTMGGHFPTIEFKRILETILGLDSIIRCEGEETLLELYNHVDHVNSWEQIKGIAYRRNGIVKITPSRPLIQNLDCLPPPIRNHETTTQRGLGICQIISSRGCYHDCSFCSIKQFYSESQGPKRRFRSPNNVVQEMSQLFHDYGIRIFIFEDDDFALKSQLQKQWVENFIKELIKEKIADQIIWRISCRVDELDAELIKKMMEVGLINIYIGIESGNNQSLKIYNKHYTVNDIKNKLNLLNMLKMPFEFGFMILNPYSTLNTVKEDIAFLKEINDSSEALVQFTKMIPYAGTPIARRLRNEGRLIGNIASPDYRYEDPKMELLQLFFTQAFYFRNFNDKGLVERLRHAKLDAIIIDKYFSNIYNAQAYKKALQDLIHICNSTCLEKMSLAVNFIEQMHEEDILINWHFLERLSQEEEDMEVQITSSLNSLMSGYS